MWSLVTRMPRALYAWFKTRAAPATIDSTTSTTTSAHIHVLQQRVEDKLKQLQEEHDETNTATDTATSTDAHTVLRVLISLQSAMGQFELTPQLIARVQSTSVTHDIEALITRLRATYALSDTVIATLLAVHVMRVYCAAHVAEAQMVLVKAELYLQQQTSAHPSIAAATADVTRTLAL